MTRPTDMMAQAVVVAEALGGEGDIPPVLAVRVPGDGRLAVVGRGAARTRRGAPLDGMPLAELMVLVAALRPDACALLMPGRRRHPETGEIVDHHLHVVGIDVTGGGNRMDVQAVPYQTTDDGLATASPMPIPVAASPLASMVLDAAVRSRVELPAVAVAAVLDGLGHRMLIDLQTPLPEAHPLMQPVPIGMTIDHVRRRVRRLADELACRHTPAGTLRERRTSPGVPHNVPVGWLPACPV